MELRAKYIFHHHAPFPKSMAQCTHEQESLFSDGNVQAESGHVSCMNRLFKFPCHLCQETVMVSVWLPSSADRVQYVAARQARVITVSHLCNLGSAGLKALVSRADEGML